MTRGAKIALGCGAGGVLGLLALLAMAVALGIWGRGGARRATAAPQPSPVDAAASPSTTPASADSPQPTAPGRYVLVDRREAAYTVYVAFPAGELDEFKSKTADQSDVEIVSWPDFRDKAERYLKERVTRYDATPESEIVDEIVDLIDNSEGAPVALTWNGGVALSANDYEAAKRAYRLAHQ